MRGFIAQLLFGKGNHWHCGRYWDDVKASMMYFASPFWRCSRHSCQDHRCLQGERNGLADLWHLQKPAKTLQQSVLQDRCLSLLSNHSCHARQPSHSPCKAYLKILQGSEDRRSGNGQHGNIFHSQKHSGSCFPITQDCRMDKCLFWYLVQTRKILDLAISAEDSKVRPRHICWPYSAHPTGNLTCDVLSQIIHSDSPTACRWLTLPWPNLLHDLHIH